MTDAELQRWRFNGPIVTNGVPVRSLIDEVLRLRGVIEEAEIDVDGDCPWCLCDVQQSGHSTKCPAFSARRVPR